MSVTHRRARLRTAFSGLLLGLLLATSGAAMIYRPSEGRFKDGFILWHEGQFYLFSMYTPNDDTNFRNALNSATTGWTNASLSLDGAGRWHHGVAGSRYVRFRWRMLASMSLRKRSASPVVNRSSIIPDQVG